MAFQKSDEEVSGLTPTAALATGTGTMGGSDPYLTLAIHLMAATLAGRDMRLFTFGDTRLKDDLQRLHKFLLGEEVKVCDLVRIIDDFRYTTVKEKNNLPKHIEDSVIGCFELADEKRSTNRKRAKKCCSLS